MSKHTPGPWTANRAYRIDKEYGRIALIVPVNGENPIAEMTPDYIADMTQANARLIAAAPELLEACIGLCSDELTGEQFATRLAYARAIIAKAAGGVL